MQIWPNTSLGTAAQSHEDPENTMLQQKRWQKVMGVRKCVIIIKKPPYEQKRERSDNSQKTAVRRVAERQGYQKHVMIPKIPQEEHQLCSRNSSNRRRKRSWWCLNGHMEPPWQWWTWTRIKERFHRVNSLWNASCLLICCDSVYRTATITYICTCIRIMWYWQFHVLMSVL